MATDTMTDATNIRTKDRPARTRPAARSDLWLALRKGARLLWDGKFVREPSSFKRVLGKARWLLIKHLSIDEVVLPFLGDLKLSVSTSDNIIACDVYLDGQFGYEQFETALVYLKSYGYLHPGSTSFVDVGANIGTHSLYALRSGMFSRVISIEPEPRNFEFLVRNLRINGFDTSDTRNVGLSDTDRESSLDISSDNFGDHRISRDPWPGNASASVRVHLVNFSSLAADVRLDQATSMFFWVDTQGHEFEVLNGIGAPRLRQSACTLEFWPSLLQANGTLERLVDLVSSVADRYLVLQEPNEVRAIETLPDLARGLLLRKHPQDQVDILVLGRDLRAGA